MFRFIPDHVGGIGTKRKQAPRSCDHCRKRHKRCVHLRPHSENLASEASRDLEQPPEEHSEHEGEFAGSTKDTFARFVGDLSPEASFLSNHRRDLATGQRPRHAEVGVWLGRNPEERSEPSRHENPPAQDDRGNSQRHHARRGTNAMSAELRQECLSTLPQTKELEGLTTIYYDKIDPIYPILREESFESHSSLDRIVLKQCICLIASADPGARLHLRLPQKEGLLSLANFRASIFRVVKLALDMDFIENNFVLLQACVMMSFSVDRTKSSEISSYYVSQAVHHCQTLGLHLGWPAQAADTERPTRLFWCVWVLDRLNAATNGRPILMHQQDMDERMLETHKVQTPAFKLLIRITQLLDSVIARYRPNSSTAHAELFNEEITYETIVQEVGAQDLSTSTTATLELFWLAVIILKHRSPNSYVHGQRSPGSDYQVFAATSITSIISETPKKSITYWPVVPYAVSLASSIAYQTLRNSCMVHRRKRAYVLFQQSCEILEQLGQAFSSARTMARLATDTLQEVERVASDRNKARNLSKSGQVSSQASYRGTNTPVGKTQGRGGEQSYGGLLDPSQAEQLDIDRQLATDEPSRGEFESHIGSPTIFGDLIGEAGLFNDFNPEFDLERIDQLFSANLDPTHPMPLYEWHELGE